MELDAIVAENKRLSADLETLKATNDVAQETSTARYAELDMKSKADKVVLEKLHKGHLVNTIRTRYQIILMLSSPFYYHTKTLPTSYISVPCLSCDNAVMTYSSIPTPDYHHTNAMPTLSDYVAKIAALTEEATVRAAEKKSSIATISTLKEQIAPYCVERLALTESAEATREQLATCTIELRCKTKDFEIATAKSDKDHSEAMEDLSALKATAIALQDELDSARAKVVTSTTELKALKDAVNKAEETASAENAEREGKHNKALTKCKANVDALETTKECDAAQIAELTKQSTLQDAALVAEKASSTATISTLTEQASSDCAARSLQDKLIESNQDQLAACRAEKEYLGRKNQELGLAKAQSDADLSKAKEALKVTSSVLSSRDLKEAKLQEELTSARAELEESRERLSRLESELANAQEMCGRATKLASDRQANTHPHTRTPHTHTHTPTRAAHRGGATFFNTLHFFATLPTLKNAFIMNWTGGSGGCKRGEHSAGASEK